jgi:hypothetical protein
MKTSKPSDWKTIALPAKRTTISLDRAFTSHEMELIRKGLIPQQMEDKWFIYWTDDSLCFHRGWTGACIYVVHFVNEDDAWRMVEADVNRDPEQYGETDDKRDAQMISYLVDVLLLQKEADFPCDEASSDKAVLTNWRAVGRAMLGEHPDEE